MKLKKLYRLFFITIILGCSDHDPILPNRTEFDPTFLENSGLSDYQIEVVNYFTDITLGFEFGNASRMTRKWKGEMAVYVSGDVTIELEEELQKIIDELNSLITDDFEIVLVDDRINSDFHVFIGSADEYVKVHPDARSYVSSNWGLFFVWWDSQNNLNRGHMYVDNERANSEAQRHLLREEFTQSLGLARDADTYSNSIFQSSWTTTTSYAEIDKEIIRLLYHPRVTSGLFEGQVVPILIDILLNE